MAERAFLDTNILLYSISEAVTERAKRMIAEELLAGRDRVVSLQVFHEFYHQATHLRRVDALSPDHAWGLIRRWSRFDVQENSLAILQAAHAMRERTRYSIWDCLMLAAARAQRCTLLYSEDMSDGHVVDDVRIVNPFRKGAALS